MSGVIQTEECLLKEQYKKKRQQEEREGNWKGKEMHGQYNREASDDIDKNKMR